MAPPSLTRMTLWALEILTAVVLADIVLRQMGFDFIFTQDEPHQTQNEEDFL
jgi:hypothetical protein